jgi:hypothetical protein
MENADTAMMEMAAAFQRGITNRLRSADAKKLSPQARDYGLNWLSDRVHASNTRWNAVRGASIKRAEEVGRDAASNSGTSAVIQKAHLMTALEKLGRLRSPCPF